MARKKPPGPTRCVYCGRPTKVAGRTVTARSKPLARYSHSPVRSRHIPLCEETKRTARLLSQIRRSNP